MTPEERSKALVNWASINLGINAADEFFGIVADCQAAARLEALEEAAKIIEDMNILNLGTRYPNKYPGPGLAEEVVKDFRGLFAAAIREKAKE